jgi:hypothetical protein
MRVARLRKAYVAIGAGGVANPWLRVRRSPGRRPGTKCLEWSKKKRSVPKGQDDCVGATVDSITGLSTCQHDLCRPTREYIITSSLRDGLLFLRIPGTPCQATIVQSLRDKEDQP